MILCTSRVRNGVGQSGKKHGVLGRTTLELLRRINTLEMARIYDSPGRNGGIARAVLIPERDCWVKWLAHAVL